MISENSKKEIKNRLNRGYSSMFVLGQGIDEYILGGDETEFNYLKLLSNSQSSQIEAWRYFLQKSAGNDNKIKFFEFFSNELAEFRVPIKSKLYILKKGILDSLSNVNRRRASILELNGNIRYAFDEAKSKFVDINLSSDLKKFKHSFPKERENYSSVSKEVYAFEESFECDWINIIFFVGCSGNCKVTESMLNRSLINKTYIVSVLDGEESNYIHEAADLRINIDYVSFFNELYNMYTDEEGNYK